MSRRSRYKAALAAGAGAKQQEVPLYDPEAVTPATRPETMPLALAAIIFGFIALLVCLQHGWLLLYGDAVSHLGIARRLTDTRNPGLAQLGGVWLPLPHLLMAPFAAKMEWWQTGMAGAWPSLLCYVFGVAGFYRLARRVLLPRWALVATAFYGLNPNLLYLATTAMTEPLFLALLIWIVLLTMECCAAIVPVSERQQEARAKAVAARLLGLGVLIFAAVMTRYDGWILGAAVWCLLAWKILRERDLRGRVGAAFVVFTLITVAGPVSWLWYNQHFAGDWLDFMRGPYSAAGIDKRTSPPGSHHYRGWHNMGWSLLFYTRTAQVDAAAWELGFGVMAAALVGLYVSVKRRLALASTLLWLPLPFYVYSVAYGSVPIFIPQLYPHSYYNSRYGMELLPALAVFGFLAVQELQARLAGTPPLFGAHPLIARLLPQGMLALVAGSALWMMHSVPLVLQEGMHNSMSRVGFETALARQLDELQPGLPILMYNSDHVGALEMAGIPLKQTVNEGDWDSWSAALKAPAEHAAYVVAMDGDAVAKAVAAHPAGLTEQLVLCNTGQPCARIYVSDRFAQR
jgi:hypothetical protein